MLMGELKYRSDIDGLRAVAVLPVILFHSGVPWLSGGFVGVDIFFVISGYLISSIMLHALEEGKFSLFDFYERRIRRIIPALVVVLFLTVVLFQIIALPDQAKGAAESGLAALLSGSNIYFWRVSGYFAPAAETMPLLHTWSLAIEVQFYLIFPLGLLALWKLRLPLRWVLGIGILAVFILSFWLSKNMPVAAFYLLPSRVWELAIGAAIAAGVVPAIKGSVLRQTVPVLGIGLILFSMFYIHRGMVFPGWVALIPCLGAAMILHTDGTSWIARRFLATRPLVFVGLLSYSLYLWHWPVLTALRMRTVTGHLEPWVLTGSLIVIFVVAWLSWRYVEGPFRSRRVMPARRMFGLLGAGSAVIAGIAVPSIVTGGFSARLKEPARVALAAARDIDPLMSVCVDLKAVEQCRFGNPNGPVTHAIIGDSHAAALRPAIEASGLMGDAAWTLFWSAGCSILDGQKRLDSPSEVKLCEAFRAGVWKQIEADRHLTTVILAGRWPYYMTGLLPELGASYRMLFADDETISPSLRENEHVFARSLARTLDRLLARGIKVTIIGSIPEAGFDVPHVLALARQTNFAEPRGIRRSDVEARAGLADHIIAQIVAERTGVRFLSIWETFCDAQWCRVSHDGVPIYFDDNHLTYTGALSVGARFGTLQLWGESKGKNL